MSSHATIHEPAPIRQIHLAQLRDMEPLPRADSLHGNAKLNRAIDGLRDHLLSLYVAAEEIHWYLRGEKREMQSWPVFADQAEVARQLSGTILRAIVRSVCLQQRIAGESGCDALLEAVLSLQVENDALGRKEAPQAISTNPR